MDRKKVIYIGSILIITVIVSVTYFSYAFFVHKDEQHGKLNIVAGTLDYSIKGVGVSNNRVNLAAKQVKQLTLDIKSLNEIDSKYGLYYTSSNANIKAYYKNNTPSLPLGQILKKSNNKIDVVLVNDTDAAGYIDFVITGGFVGNELTKVTNTNDIDLGVMGEDISYTDTYSTGCTDVQCILDKIDELLD